MKIGNTFCGNTSTVGDIRLYHGLNLANTGCKNLINCGKRCDVSSEKKRCMNECDCNSGYSSCINGIVQYTYFRPGIDININIL